MNLYLFTVPDPECIPVSLSEAVWYGKILHPVLGHPEIKPYLAEVKLTIEEPDYIYPSNRDVRSKLFYRAGLTKGFYEHCYIVVVVKYVPEVNGKVRGYVSTAFLTSQIKAKGEPIWKKKALP